MFLCYIYRYNFILQKKYTDFFTYFINLAQKIINIIYNTTKQTKNKSRTYIVLTTKDKIVQENLMKKYLMYLYIIEINALKTGYN